MRNLLFVCTFLFSCLSHAQNYQLLKKIDVNASFMTTDALEHCYLISKNHVHKYNDKGELLKKYSNNNYAEIASIDASNPYKLLVFYQNFGKLLFLDNMLSDNGTPIDLFRSEYNQTSLACPSFENGYWIYEPILNSLVKLNTHLEVTQQTGNLSMLLRSKLNPNFLVELNSRVYLNNPKTGILVFDQFGTYLKTIAIPNLPTFQVKNDRIHYVKEQQLHTYYFKSLDTEITPLPISEDIQNVHIQKQKLFILTSNSLFIYQIK
jgi:hypothetical protein